jgi:hypothetical protein
MKLTVTGNSVRLLNYSLVTLDGAIPEEPTVAAMVDGLMGDIEKRYGSIFSKRIGYATADFQEVALDLTQDGSKDTPIGNLVTDAFRALTKTDIALEVGGSTAQPIYQGPLVAADLFRVVGYGFNMENGLGYRLATMRMSGAAIVAGLEVGLSLIEADDEFFVQSSGLTYVYNASYPIGQRVKGVMVGTLPLNPAKEYTVTTNEFVPLVLANYQIPVSDVHICTGDTTEFQVLCQYVARLDTISPIHRNGIVSPVKKTGQVVPKKFALGQNYPNPFNPSTTIEFSVPTRCDVSLRVYNILGQPVASLVHDQLNAGSYKEDFNAQNLASGLYFYVLQAGETKLTKKMTLLK